MRKKKRSKSKGKSKEPPSEKPEAESSTIVAKILSEVDKSLDSKLKDAAAAAIETLKQKAGPLRRKLNDYERKSAACDIASKYLQDGITEISPEDRKSAGRKYLPLLEQAVDYNRNFKKTLGQLESAREKLSDYDDLRREKTALEREKTKLAKDLAAETKRCENAISKLRQQYEGAAFCLEKLTDVEQNPERLYEAAENPEALKVLEEETHYEGKPTYATARVRELVYCIQMKSKIEGNVEKRLAEMNAVIAEIMPD